MVSPEKRTDNATNEHRSLTKRQGNPVGALAVLKISCPLGTKLGIALGKKITLAMFGPLVIPAWPFAAIGSKIATTLTACLPLAAIVGK